MKKILLIVLGILGFSFNFSLAEDLPQLVLFYGETCPHCKAEEGYLDSLKEIYHFEVVGYEVYYSEENREKMKEYGEQFGTEFNGVPVVIMGNDYFLGASYDKTVALLEKYTHKIGDDSCQPEDDENNQNTNPIVECTGDDQKIGINPGNLTGENDNLGIKQIEINPEDGLTIGEMTKITVFTDDTVESVKMRLSDRPNDIILSKDGIGTFSYNFVLISTGEVDISLETLSFNDSTSQNYENIKQIFVGDSNENIDEQDQTTKIFGKEISLSKAGPILFGIALGFADGINPCMFGVLIFLLTYLVSVGSRKKVLYSGLIFVVTTFVLYSAIMYGMHKLLFNTNFFLEYISTVKYVIGILAIILGLIEVKDFFRYGKGVSLAIPKWAKPTLEYVTKKGTYMSAFVLAVLSTFVELPCTIGIPLAYVGAVGDKVNIFAALGIYNFFFVLPLIIIILGIYYGIAAFKTEDGDLAINKVSNKKIMRLVAGIILITLGVLFLTRVI